MDWVRMVKLEDMDYRGDGKIEEGVEVRDDGVFMGVGVVGEDVVEMGWGEDVEVEIVRGEGLVEE